MKAFQPDDVEIIRTAIRNRLADVRTSIPAIVKSYDYIEQTCSCELTTRIPTSDGTPEQLQPLQDVPVAWPRGGGYFCTMPLSPGDTGLLVFCEADFSAWRETGVVSDATQERRHGLYAYFIPGGCANGKELTDASPDKLIIGKQGGSVIKVDASGIELGAAASQYVALANLVSARLDAIQAKFDAHTHPVTALGSPTGPTATLIGPLAPVAAAKVKAQ